jgi:hypothetical protein
MYLQWNAALAAHFFRSDMAGRPVHLYVTEDLLTELGKLIGLAPQSFVQAVKAGPPWATRQGLCQRALQSLAGWRSRQLSYPPYVAYLALFVLAAGMEGDFAPHAYHPRLRDLLGEESRAALPSFDRMLVLWDDLERWSHRDMQGSLGLFTVTIAGNWIHVGLPRDGRRCRTPAADGWLLLLGARHAQ